MFQSLQNVKLIFLDKRYLDYITILPLRIPTYLNLRKLIFGVQHYFNQTRENMKNDINVFLSRKMTYQKIVLDTIFIKIWELNTSDTYSQLFF